MSTGHIPSSSQARALAQYISTFLHLSSWDWTRGVTEEVCLLHEMTKRFPPGYAERIEFDGLGMSAITSFQLLHRRGPNGQDASGADFALHVVYRQHSTMVSEKHAFIQLKVARAGAVVLKASQIANAGPIIDHSFVMAALRASRSFLVVPSAGISVPIGAEEITLSVSPPAWLGCLDWAYHWLSCRIGSSNPNSPDGRPLGDILNRSIERRPMREQERELQMAEPDELAKLGITARAYWNFAVDIQEPEG
jgi:hypothetical protein